MSRPEALIPGHRQLNFGVRGPDGGGHPHRYITRPPRGLPGRSFPGSERTDRARLTLRRYLCYLTHSPRQVYRFADVTDRGAPLFACQYNPVPQFEHFVMTANEDGIMLLADTRRTSTDPPPPSSRSSTTSYRRNQRSPSPSPLPSSRSRSGLGSGSLYRSSGLGRPNDEGVVVGPACSSFWSAHNNAIFDVQWHPDGSRILSASGDQTVKLWDVERRVCTALFNQTHEGSVKSCSWCSQDPFVFASAGRDGRVVVWDLRCASRRASAGDPYNLSNRGRDDALDMLIYRPADVISEAHSISDLQPAAGSSSASSTCWSALADLSISGGKIPPMTVTPRWPRSWLASAGVVNGTIKYWDTRQMGRHMGKFSPTPVEQSICPGRTGRSRGISSLAVTADGSRLMALSADHTPDNAFVASGSSDHRIYIWSIDEPTRPPLTLTSHSKEVSAVAWSRTQLGSLASCSDDHTLRLWQVDPGYSRKFAKQGSEDGGISSLTGRTANSPPTAMSLAVEDDDIGYAGFDPPVV
ncbi:WD40-repeat-containing domain protein [Dimargaris cristalligena]|uniref:WD40-repeat-containing domain protein n=1 Tax=Dimargaris cristalligena TaxID=215637 RepID=A0A4P9ZYH8_9FUNG|nr:WD40-repeat-containing domain protein [Dimargaris cristalligena]|eukprot:RKP38815.1 WD40-repeat-containing domain protein [Dimargaris cristalligena]